jgi:heparosan-N-sulfate-glucuronate 5-epimerase
VSERRRLPRQGLLAVGLVCAAIVAAVPISQAISPHADVGGGPGASLTSSAAGSVASATPALTPAAGSDASGAPTSSPSAAGSPGTAPLPAGAGSTYHPLSPVRILDSATRAGGAVPLVSATPASFLVAGAFGIPVGATAVAGTLSVSNPSHTGFVALTAVETSPATVTTMTASFTAGGSASVGVTASLGSDGRLWALYQAGAGGGTADFSFDLAGYYRPDRAGSTYHPLSPSRILDSGVQRGAERLKSGLAQSLQLGGSFGIPAGATAVTGTLSIVMATQPGRVALGPESPATPLVTSALSFTTGEAASTAVFATLGSDGKLWIEYESAEAAASAQFLFDLSGYFTPDLSGSTFHRFGPLRLIDSRARSGFSSALSSEVPRSLRIAGLYGIPAAATAVTGTLTLVKPTRRGYVAFSPTWPFGPEIPGSSGDAATPDAYTMGVTSALAGDGSLRAMYRTGQAGDTTDILFDLHGYFAPEVAPASLPAYFEPFSPPADTAHFDSNGVLLIWYEAPDYLSYNPVAISQAAIAYFDRWHSAGETPAQAEQDRKSFFNQVNWLMANQQSDGIWLFRFQWGQMKKPWWSAMAQGQALSVLLRAYWVSGDDAYLGAARKALSTFDRLTSDRGATSLVTVQGRQLRVCQEYLPGMYHDNVLNGWIFALAGLYEYAIYTGDPEALYQLVAADRGLPAVRYLLPWYDTGKWSYYAIDSFTAIPRGPNAHVTYHALHIRQLRWLYSLTGDAVMSAYADRFQLYWDHR